VKAQRKSPLRAVLRDARARIIRIREALVDGDNELVELMLCDLDDDLARALGHDPFRCRDCPATFEWGEQLIEHRERMHPEEDLPW
jgi:hypothetical protein